MSEKFKYRFKKFWIHFLFFNHSTETILLAAGLFMNRTHAGGDVKPLSANPTKWSNPLKQFVGKSRRIL